MSSEDRAFCQHVKQFWEILGAKGPIAGADTTKQEDEIAKEIEASVTLLR